MNLHCSSRPQRHARPAAFTIIELMAVMVIVGLLSGIGIVGLNAISERSENRFAAGELERVRTAQMAFAAKYTAFTPDPTELGAVEGLTVTSNPATAAGQVSMAVGKSGALAIATLSSGGSCETLWVPALGGSTQVVKGTLPAGSLCDGQSALIDNDPPIPVVPVNDGAGSSSSLTAPLSLSAVAGSGEVTLSWQPVLSNPPVNGYRVYWSTGSGAVLGCQTTALTCTVTGLNNGTTYSFTVLAHRLGIEGPASSSVDVSPSGVPGQVASVVATPGETTASLSWGTPTSGTADITDYDIRWSNDNGTTWNTVTKPRSTARSYTVANLVPTQTYIFQVRATNDLGPGNWSVSSAPVTLYLAMTGPTGVTATEGNAQVTVAWNPNAAGQAVSGYRVYYTSGGTALLGCQTANTTCTITGLTNGTTYSFNVIAYRGTSEGPASATVTAKPFLPADAPSNFVGTAGVRQISYTWTALASTAIKPVSGYRVYVNSGSGAVLGCQVLTAASTTCTATGLSNGTSYSANVFAYYASTEGAASNVATVSTFALPGAPTSPVGTSGANTQSVVTWTAPVSNGGTAITGYEVSVYNSSGGAPTGVTGATTRQTGSTATSYTFTGLTNGTAYTFKVAAINGAGTGAQSSASVAATPYTTTATPSAPTISGVAATTLTVGWSYPINNGGATATSMSIQRSTNLTTWTTLGNYSGATASMSGLTRNTTYYYRVAANNAAGMSSYSTATSVTTLANTTTVYISDWSHTWVAWTWSNAGASNYQVWYNGVYQGVTGATSWSVSGRSSNTDHSLYVVPLNSAGVASAASNTVTQRTLSQGGSEPFGFQDSVYPGSTPVNQPMTASGWVIDPENWRPISVHVYAYGTVYSPAGTWAIATTANLNRPDIAAAYPGYGPYHGYSGTVTAGGNGAYNVCSYAINTYGAGGNTLLGCQGSYGR